MGKIVSDDIVIQLRDLAYIIDNSVDRARVVMVSGEVLSQAANEIETLRADRDRWNNVAELAMQAHHDDCWTHVYDAYESAVLGE